MLRNYLKIAWRSLKRNFGYTALNLIGLAVGLAACLIIALYVQHELSFDRFHEKSERIFRVASSSPDQTIARTSLPAGPILQERYPSIEHAVRFNLQPETLVAHGERAFYEDRFAYTDPSFFEVFDFELIAGDPQSDLARPYTILLSESKAEKYFPNEDPIGQTLLVDNEEEYEVVGLFVDPPANSHIQFDFLSSIESEFASGVDRDRWDRAASTYLLFQNQQQAPDVEAELTSFYHDHLPEWMSSAQQSYVLTPLHDIRLHATQEWEQLPQADIRQVYLFSAVAILILLIACINYMNLATARAMKRTREVGIRKTAGASRGQLVRQFLAESIVLTAIAVIFALLLARGGLPIFNSIMETPLSLTLSGWMVPLLLFGIILVGVLAGSYPAAFLSGFKPVDAIHDRISGGRATRLRKGLIVFQFGLSAALIVATLTLNQQMQFIQSERPGFGEEQIVMMPTHGEVGGNAAALRAEMARDPAVEQATLTTFSADQWGAIFFLTEESVEHSTFEGSIAVHGIEADEGFLETFGIQLLDGRNLEDGDDNVTLVNQTAVARFGWDDPIGSSVTFSGELHRVIGVVEDFTIQSLREERQPVFIHPGGDAAFAMLAAKVQPGTIQESLSHLEAQWAAFVPDRPFSYRFLDAQFDQLYQNEIRLTQLFSAAAALAILIACLGLIGLAAYTAQLRRKEIGIRKVLGATAASVIGLLSKDFLKLILLAFAMGAPVAYWAMNRWLDGFAYRIEIGTGLIVLAGLLLVSTAFLALLYHALKAAWMNPTEAIRSE